VVNCLPNTVAARERSKINLAGNKKNSSPYNLATGSCRHLPSKKEVFIFNAERHEIVSLWDNVEGFIGLECSGGG